MAARNTNSSKLLKLSDRLYVLPFENKGDRPNLYYIKGDDHSLAVDAGNSPAHVHRFYEAIRAAGLPLPRYTVISHWHWDHTFGLPAIVGTSVSTRLTHDKLNEVAKWRWDPDSMKKREESGEDIPFCNENIRIEYPDLSAIKVVTTDETIENRTILDPGGIEVQLIPLKLPHSPDALFVYLPSEKALIVEDGDCEDFYNGNVYDRELLDGLIAFLEPLAYERHYLGHADSESKSEALKRLKQI